MSSRETAPRGKQQEFKEQVRRQWTDADVVAAWGKWHDRFSAQTRFATKVIVEAAQVEPGMEVLDLACGTGEPALALAKAVGPAGHVTLTDISPGMIEIAQANARKARLANLTARLADAEALPFADETFDVVTSRFGIMFCPDYGQALREVRRVLRPGGRVALIVWGPQDQALFRNTVGVLSRHVETAKPDPGAPTPFVFAKPGTLSAALSQAGFREVHEANRTVPWPFPGSVQDLWQFLWEAGGPAFGAIYEKLPRAQLESVFEEIYAALQPFSNGREVDTKADIVDASATR